jgi:hypothetical protein
MKPGWAPAAAPGLDAWACWVGVTERSTGLVVGAVWVGGGAWLVLLPRLPLLLPPPTRASAMAGTRRTIAATAASQRLVFIFPIPLLPIMDGADNVCWQRAPFKIDFADHMRKLGRVFDTAS